MSFRMPRTRPAHLPATATKGSAGPHPQSPGIVVSFPQTAQLSPDDLYFYAVPARVRTLPYLESPTLSLSEDATRYAVCTWKLIPHTTIKATYPEKLAPETRGSLDELTMAGLLSREDDPRGPTEWKPTEAMRQFTAARPLPAELL